ncbi:AMP-binding protein [Paraferrimonas haliotis]|uniref:Surfactin synthetase n=1 Tax=Paraferrimonas haliotis TaxID=2013866 RepID=A0AA37TXI2_9GAMM|nr:AMP-binding protein [Paraferrimonas haliotis]GLS83171.1 surfactin synthetase [Paraferrimonas haliotis]
MKHSLLHNLLCEHNGQRVIAYRSATPLTLRQLQTDCAHLVTRLKAHQARDFAIVCDEPWSMLVALLSCHQADKHAILPSNLQPKNWPSYRLKWPLISNIDAALHHNDVAVEIGSKQALEVDFSPLDGSACGLSLFTSGSSGEPTQISKTLQLLEREAQELQQQFCSDEPVTRVTASVAHNHIYGLLFRVVWPLLANRPFDCGLIEHEEALMLQLTKQTLFVASPAFLERLGQMEQLQGQCHSVFSSGGPLSFEAVESCSKRLQCRPIEVYGSTETGGIAFRQRQHANQPWQAFSCVELAIHNQCLVVRSPYIEAAYFATKDQVELQDSNLFSLVGRQDRIVKIAEKRVSLDEIELALKQSSLVDDCAALAVTQGKQLRIVCAVALSEEGKQHYASQGHSWLWRELRKCLSGLLEPVALPRKIKVVGFIPRNSQFKLDLAAIKELFHD